MIIRIIINYLLQIASTIGLILLSGKIIALLNGYFYKQLGSRSRAVCYATGFIGTPLHESAHALACLIFGHKITEIKFFQTDSSDGVLGYVCHSYNPKNLWQKIGNFFIGTAPIVVGYLVLFGLFYICMPSLCQNIMHAVQEIDIIGNLGNSIKNLGAIYIMLFKGALNWKWWIFVIIGSFIALHMTLSDADMQGAKSGIIVLLITWLVIVSIVGIVSSSFLIKLTNYILVLGNFILFFFMIFLIVSLLLCIISTIIFRIKR